MTDEEIGVNPTPVVEDQEPVDEEIRVKVTPVIEDQEPVAGPVCDPVALKTWVEEEAQGGTPEGEMCRSCVLPVAMGWYLTELNEGGFGDLASELDQVKDSGDAVKVAEFLDRVKAEVPESVRARLKDFDCALQVNVQMDADET